MRIGLQIALIGSGQKPLGEYIVHIAEQADQAGFATLVIPDHFSLRPESTPFFKRDEYPPVIDFFEAWSVLAFIAARTSSSENSRHSRRALQRASILGSRCQSKLWYR
ncbi:MAG: LLM class flavin-dependent oxidoreductase [Chloroflexi bacterium]|nr:MAG: LLM class flavin-dependent oxidoreductase [Chloroflexota bacterium]